MLLEMYCVYDMKVKAYTSPSYFRTRGEAVRSFMDACSDGKSNFVRHPEDYVFFLVGHFDEASGSVSPVIPCEPVCKAIDFVDVKKEV